MGNSGRLSGQRNADSWSCSRVNEVDRFCCEFPEVDDCIDTRGFAMRRGNRGRVVHRKKRGEAEFELPGRSSFKRRANGHRDVYRCSMCKPGRHHGAGGAKSLKKVQGSQARNRWLDVLGEARDAEHSAEPDEVLLGPRATSSPRKPLAAQDSPPVPVPLPVPVPVPSSSTMPLTLAFAQTCPCRGCPPQRKRSWQYRIIPENAHQRRRTDAADYERILAELPFDDEWQLAREEEWLLL